MDAMGAVGPTKATLTPEEVTDALAEWTGRFAASHTHCRYCGRQLENVESRGGFDPETGNPQVVVWRECPLFRRSWRNLWLGGAHESWKLDMPATGRERR